MRGDSDAARAAGAVQAMMSWSQPQSKARPSLKRQQFRV